MALENIDGKKKKPEAEPNGTDTPEKSESPAELMARVYSTDRKIIDEPETVSLHDLRQMGIPIPEEERQRRRAEERPEERGE